MLDYAPKGAREGVVTFTPYAHGYVFFLYCANNDYAQVVGVSGLTRVGPEVEMSAGRMGEDAKKCCVTVRAKEQPSGGGALPGGSWVAMYEKGSAGYITYQYVKDGVAEYYFDFPMSGQFVFRLFVDRGGFVAGECSMDGRGENKVEARREKEGVVVVRAVPMSVDHARAYVWVGLYDAEARGIKSHLAWALVRPTATTHNLVVPKEAWGKKIVAQMFVNDALLASSEEI